MDDVHGSHAIDIDERTSDHHSIAAAAGGPTTDIAAGVVWIVAFLRPSTCGCNAVGGRSGSTYFDKPPLFHTSRVLSCGHTTAAAPPPPPSNYNPSKQQFCLRGLGLSELPAAADWRSSFKISLRVSTEQRLLCLAELFFVYAYVITYISSHYPSSHPCRSSNSSPPPPFVPRPVRSDAPLTIEIDQSNKH